MGNNELIPEVLGSIQPFDGAPPKTTTDLIGAGAQLQKTQTAYTTAVAVSKPRTISRVTSNVIEEAKLAGSSFYYRWEVWDKAKGRKVPIEGPSIDLAMCVARNYGNCVLDIEATETPTHYMMKGVFIDLETGFTCPRLFRQRKGQSISGKMDAERQEDIVFQIGQSKAVRNAVVRAMPSWLLDKAIEVAKQSELSQIRPENMAITRANVIDFFSKYGVEIERIEAVVGRNADNWTPNDIVDLKGSATALKEGRISAEQLFPLLKKEDPDAGQQHTKKDEQESSPESQAEGSTGAAPSEKAPEENQKVDTSAGAWQPDKWKTMKAPGIKRLAEREKDSFVYVPELVREDFRKKWGRLDALATLAFPFDKEGAWVGYGTPDTPAAQADQPTNKDPGSMTYADVPMELMDEFNELWVKGYRAAKDLASQDVGCGTFKPKPHEVKTWVTFYKAHLERLLQDQGENDAPPHDGPPDGPF